jgi:primosomal protein N' (replication factor Y)
VPALTRQSGRVVQVVPLLRVRQLGDRRFDYLVPPEFEERVRLGSLVSVPFGPRVARAVVVDMTGSHDRRATDLRFIETVHEQTVPEELLDLARSLSERYLCSFESCLRLMAPPVIGATGAPAGARKTWVMRTSGPHSSLEQENAPSLTPKQQALLEAVPAEGIAASELLAELGVGRGVLRTLVAKGLVELVGTAPAEAAPGARAAEEATAVAVVPPLWPEQERAVLDLLAAYAETGFTRRLLWGVTGSGKTEVYLRLLARALDDGAGAILLVPEIALTPQMIGRVRARFGNRVGVMHSGLPRGERAREFRRIAGGDAPLVVGARSAVFAPVMNLRLIILDESHDTSYKQEEEPRYHARTVARMRLEPGGGLLIEGSATPSVESMQRSEGRLRLSRRAAGTPPVCEVVDMRRQGAGLLLAPRSREALAETLRRGEQAIVLLNRRGYAGHVHCDLCGHVMMCADCELSLTYHSRVRRLLCHHCGRAYTQPTLCPACGGAPLTRASPGTERLDQELRALVPHEQVFRMDSDVLTSGERVRAILGAFAEARPGVLVGTQMVAKGHDFPEVTLVVVADADTGLYVPDFRATERTFQLLTQVAGRAGRAQRPGRVLVQTWNPDVHCIRMALEQDEHGFYQEELAGRERLGYPPFADLIRLMTVAKEPERAQSGARLLVERLAPHFSAQELRGPSRLAALRGRDRWHLLVAARDGERARAIVGQALAQLAGPYRRRGVTLLVDVDPQSFS